MVKLLLHVKAIGFKIKHFKCLLLRLVDLLIDKVLEVVKLLDNVSLALIKCTLYLLQINFSVKLTTQVMLRLSKFLRANTAHYVAPDLFHVVIDLVRLLLVVLLAVLN